MEVFKLWLGDYGLVTSEDCLDVEGNRTLFSVRKLNRQGKETALVEAATLNENPVAKVTK